MRYGGKLDPDFDVFLRKIVENTKSMAQLMTDLLQYAGAGEAQDATSPTANAEEVLDAVLRNLQVVIDESKAVMTHDPLPAVSVSPTELTQLLESDCKRHPLSESRSIAPNSCFGPSEQRQFLRRFSRRYGVGVA